MSRADRRMRLHAAGGIGAIALCLLIARLGAATTPLEQDVDEQRAARVKAAYLYNFVKFVKWPDDAYHGDEDPIVIGVLGKDPFGDVLDRSVRAKKVGNRSITVRRIEPPRDSSAGDHDALHDAVTRCHLLYISPSETDSFAETLESIGTSSVLTVSDIESFASSGGMIEFVLDDGRIVLHINRRVAETARLRMSSKLLSLATIVETETP